MGVVHLHGASPHAEYGVPSGLWGTFLKNCPVLNSFINKSIFQLHPSMKKLWFCILFSFLACKSTYNEVSTPAARLAPQLVRIIPTACDNRLDQGICICRCCYELKMVITGIKDTAFHTLLKGEEIFETGEKYI